MRTKNILFVASLLLLTAACQKEIIQPKERGSETCGTLSEMENPSDDSGTFSRMSNSNDDAGNGGSGSNGGGITDPNSDEDQNKKKKTRE